MITMMLLQGKSCSNCEHGAFSKASNKRCKCSDYTLKEWPEDGVCRMWNKVKTFTTFTEVYKNE